MNIFCLTFLNNGNEKSSELLTNFHNKNNIGTNIEQVHYDDNPDGMDDSGNVSSSHNSSSNITSMDEFRNFHSFTEQATPRTLWRVTQLIAALYMIMVLIASVNLGINLSC